jgi:hypothetical protein
MARLIKDKPDNWYIRDDWGVEDVQSQAVDMGVKLTKDQIYKVMERVVQMHDANFGINWDVIGSAIDEVMGGEE